jgi:tRNA U38,U39,U40 pseudouridine synthase TruA
MSKMFSAREGKTRVFSTEGNRYLYKIVRITVGCLVQTGLGKMNGDEYIATVNGQSKNDINFRKECAPSCRLFLDKVFY